MFYLWAQDHIPDSDPAERETQTMSLNIGDIRSAIKSGDHEHALNVIVKEFEDMELKLIQMRQKIDEMAAINNSSYIQIGN